MKKITLFALLFWSVFSVYGQLTLSSGSKIVINSGSTVVANDITNAGGSIVNNGTLSVNGDITNNTGDLLASTSTGTVKFEGAAAQEITGDHDVNFYGTVDIDNSNGVALTATSTGSDQTINGTLNFTSGNLVLNGFNLTIGSTDPTGASAATGYIETNSTGTVKRTVGSSDVLFPVGNTAYNPITLKNDGTSDDFTVYVVDHEPTDTVTVHMVDRSWVVSEGVAGGSDLTVTAQWNGSEELTGFDGTSSAIGLTTDGGATYDWGTTAAAVGTNPYTMTTAGFSGVGTFAVGDYTFSGLALDLKVYLAAAYNTTNHDMDNTLNSAGLIPTSDPYGLGTTVTTVPANAVDWVEVQLRNSADNTDTLFRFAKFVDTTGQVINEDGTDMLLTGISKTTYYVSVHHRNHLPVVSASTVDFSASSPAYSFSTGLAQAWDDATVTSNDAMKEVETGVWALWSGDATQDGSVSYNGTGNDRSSILSAVGISTPGNTITGTYSLNDVNMDGDIIYNGAGSDRSSVLSVIGVSTPGVIYLQHLPH